MATTKDSTTSSTGSMAERDNAKAVAEARPWIAAPGARDAELERALGRTLAFALPAASIVSAIAFGVLASVGSGLLVLAAGAVLGAIGLLWASVRTLSGDAPLSVGFETMTAAPAAVDALVEEKRRLLRGLKDLENEHEIGKIDDSDYQVLLVRYREEAKAVMRKMDGRVVPFRAEAERLSRDYLKRMGILSPAKVPNVASEVKESPRVECVRCGTSNEPDAAFCKQCAAPLTREQGGERT